LFLDIEEAKGIERGQALNLVIEAGFFIRGQDTICVSKKYKFS